MNAATYAATERLRNGATLHIRAQQPADRTGMLAAFGRLGKQAVYRRFFSPKRGFSEREIEYFLKVDFVGHVALVAVLAEEGRELIVGGARYIVARPGSAELAFAIVDAHQGQGIATHLIRHLTGIARAAGLSEFTAEVLPENLPMLKVFARCGLAMTTRRERGVVHVTLALGPDAGGTSSPVSGEVSR
jgi:RimJ/RimL family protein N-acetyltransferase